MSNKNSFVDYVYDNKFRAENSKINYTKSINVKEIFKKELEKDLLENFTDGDFEDLLEYSRNNPQKVFTKEEAEIINAKLQETKREAKKVLNEIRDKKEHLYKKVKESGEGFVLDISKNNSLKRSSNRIFGGNKNQIEFDDYITLLEMRKQIQFNEALDLIVGEDNGNV